MDLDERHRHDLHNRLEDVLGAESAATLMAHLPPAGWADVATKHDLAQLEERLDLRFEALEHRFDRRYADLRVEMHDLLRRQTWTQVIATLMAVATTAGTVLAAT